MFSKIDTALSRVALVAVIVIAIMLVWDVTISGATEFEPTPHDRIAGEVAAYESFAQGAELTRMLRAYADRQPCLSMQLRDGEHVFFWWCSRFKMVDEVEL